ncbi:c-type cytochrome [Phenylobacterium sp. VNQ135]|uniref:c-type cytochrome n=1 Tax=Phenylobacterium sp. VNQ135 TaxID=3400922 RepID=UPI003C067F04
MKIGTGMAVAATLATLGAWTAATAGAAPSAEGAPFSKEQAEAGRQLYETQCVECHAADLSGAKGTPLRGEAFQSKWHGQTIRSLYAKIRATMPPEDPGSLSESETLAITAYLLSHQEKGLSGEPATSAADLGERRLVLR